MRADCGGGFGQEGGVDDQQTDREFISARSSMSIIDDVEARRDARYGVGKWHCDDLWAAKSLPPCAQAYLDVARGPAHGRGRQCPALFATHDGQRVRVVMASRFGDVGISLNLDAETGYSKRVLLPDLTDLSATSDATPNPPPINPHDPDHTRAGMFVYHNCWKCQSGDRPCVNGNPRRCEFPHARND